MDKFKKFVNAFVDHMIILIIILSVIAFYYPAHFVWMTEYTSIFLAIAMFGMGTNIDLKTLKDTLVHPKEILIGVFLQFLLMPTIAMFLCKAFALPKEIALGVVLVGSCPGGTASNVITHIAGGDVTLSVTMTTVSTLLAPLLTPLLVYGLAGQWVEVSLLAMFITVIKVILIPVVLGLVVKKILKEKMEYISPALPLVSSVAIIMIIAGIIAINADKIVQSGLMVTGIVFLHNIIGLLAGLGLSKLFRVEETKQTAVAIEVGMQNSGLAVSLATANFPLSPMASLPGAIFSVMHNLTGTVFANIRKKKHFKTDQAKPAQVH